MLWILLSPILIWCDDLLRFTREGGRERRDSIERERERERERDVEGEVV